MKKSGWLLLPAAFFLLVNFAVSPVKILFFSRLIYFLLLSFLFLILRRYSLDKILPPIVAGVSFILFFYGIIQKFVLFPYYLHQVHQTDNFYSQALITRIKSGRIFSLFPLPTLYAIICTALILFIFHYFLISTDKKIKISWALLLLAGLFNLLLTQSFGGILYFSMGILLYLLLSGILKLRYLVPILMTLSFFLFITIALRFSEAKELEPVKLRWSNWAQASRIINSAPFWGVGLGNYEAKVSYYTLSSEAKSLYAHNFFLQFLAETGIFISCFLLLFLFVVRKKLKPKDHKEKIVYLSVFLVMLFYNTIDIGFYFFSAGIIAAIALSQIYPKRAPRAHPVTAAEPGIKKGENIMPGKDIRGAMIMVGFVLLCLLMLVESISRDRRQTADLFYAQRDYENARQYYRKSFKINPFNYHALVKYAEVCFRLNNPREAEKYLDKALKLYPGLTLANYLQSQILFKRKKLFQSYYYSAAAFDKNKLNSSYKQWFEFLRQGLEKLLADSQSQSYWRQKTKKVSEK
ncbi:MAG: tetratricopeptide repeat protein [Candidatus Aminicenantes bacterium]|jgi:tetratricopeptide (TPR) repeat protein